MTDALDEKMSEISKRAKQSEIEFKKAMDDVKKAVAEALQELSQHQVQKKHYHP